MQHILLVRERDHLFSCLFFFAKFLFSFYLGPLGRGGKQTTKGFGVVGAASAAAAAATGLVEAAKSQSSVGGGGGGGGGGDFLLLRS